MSEVSKYTVQIRQANNNKGFWSVRLEVNHFCIDGHGDTEEKALKDAFEHAAEYMQALWLES